MGTRYMLDSNIAIYFLNGQLPPKTLDFILTIIESECNISVISKIELLGWQAHSAGEQENIQGFVNEAVIIHLDDEIVEKTIELRKLYKMQLPDAVIAATAIVYNFVLISRNDKDFHKIAELNYQNPFI